MTSARSCTSHWENKKRRSALISSPDVDRWYAIARESGALGGKIVGAGGGDSSCSTAQVLQRRRCARRLPREGLREMSYAFDYDGAKVMLNV